MSWKNEIKLEIEKNNFDLGSFTLKEFYKTSLTNLEYIFKENASCGASIRANLQKLRDEHYLEFIDKGKYRVIGEENNEWNKFINEYHKNEFRVHQTHGF